MTGHTPHNRNPYAPLNFGEHEVAVHELQHALPAHLPQLRDLLPAGERVLFTFSVDMTTLGRYGDQWLLLTEKRCLVWDEGDEEVRRVTEFSVSDLKDVRLREMVGNHMLFVDLGDGWQRLLRASKQTAWKLRPLQQVLKRARDEGPESLADVGGLELRLPERQVCGQCGRVIHPRLRVCMACLNKRKLFARMLRLLLPYKAALALVLVLMGLGGGIGLIQPLITKWVPDLVFVPAVGGKAPAESFWYQYGEPGSWELLLLFGGMMFLILLVSPAIGAVREYVNAWIGNRIVLDLSNRVFAHMMRLSLSYYHQNDTGEVMSRITRDVNRVHRFLVGRLPNMLFSLVMLVGYLGLMLGTHWQLALIVLFPVPFLALASEIARRKVHRIYRTLWSRYASINRFLADVIPGIRVVKAFARGRHERSRFKSIMSGVFEYEMRGTAVRVVLGPVFQLGTGIGHILVFVAGGWLLIRGGAGGAVTIGTITMFTGLMWQFNGTVTSLAAALPDFERAFTSADRVFDVLDSEPDIEGEDRTIEMPPIEGTVEFRNVTFGYAAEEPVLRDISFTAKPGDMIGLVGRSGAGKTTVINLICHFYRVDEGQVLIDGHDLAHVKVESLRRQIGVVSQEPFLFRGTIAQNIAYGKPDATLMEVIAAAKAANAHEFILKFREGYDTMLGERGVRVSGGERQRLAIARAILRDPRILILDEATASVDTETEEKIQSALQRLVAGRTTFAIAHRLSTLKFANRLIVIEKGKLVETGTHQELLAHKGVYAGLCEKQTRLARLNVWSE